MNDISSFVPRVDRIVRLAREGDSAIVRFSLAILIAIKMVRIRRPGLLKHAPEVVLCTPKINGTELTESGYYIMHFSRCSCTEFQQDRWAQHRY